MNRRMLARIAALSLVLGISTMACTPDGGSAGGHVAGLADRAPPAPKDAARQADRARAALAAHQGEAAVDAAEKAVALDPRNPAGRMILGQAYLAAGRFSSARASFRDTLTLDPGQARARFDMALTEIAQGDRAEALDMLHGLEGAIPAGDMGLALALAGDGREAIAMLVDLVRSGHSDARIRQNLALSYALDGRWREARAVAMQDTPADRIDAQLAHWADLARPESAGAIRVAAIFGVAPASDPGLPAALALAAPSPAAPPVRSALADPASPGVPVAAQPAEVAVAQAASSVTIPLDAPAPAAMPAAAPVAIVPESRRREPARRAVPPLLRASRAPFRVAAQAEPGAPSFRRGGYVVQLGAFSRTGAIQAAWEKASRALPRLSGYAPVRAGVSLSGGSLVRLSVSGFDRRADAVALCAQIRRRGGACFVRAAAGDAPLRWAKRETGAELASL